jgi:DNA-binding SARP family transcriptional activator/predicted ATPase
MSTIQLKLLGVPQLLRDDQVVVLRRAKATALLVYLAAVRVAQPRERVLDLLWPESKPQAARKNMRNTLWEISEALGHDVLEQQGQALRIAPEVVIDLHQFEDGLLLLESGTVTALEQLVALYRGPLADGLVVNQAVEFELWLEAERERLTALYLRLLERIVALRRSMGDWQAVAAQARRALAADPLREAMHIVLIEALLHLGQRAQAMQQYASLTELLWRELAVTPLPETAAHYEALLSNLPQPTAPPPAPPTAPQPEPLPPLVGRTAELALLDAELARVRQGSARVVLITGELGVGKTHLWQQWTSAQQATVLHTYALEIGEPLPFGPLLTLFRRPGPAQQIVRSPSPLAPIWLAELARLLPEIAQDDLPVRPDVSSAEERARLFQALAEAIRLLIGPLAILVIDDLHWADATTLDFLLYLSDYLREQPLLLIGCFRPPEANERLLALQATWLRHGVLQALSLSRLSTAEAQTLLNTWGTTASAQQQAHWIEQSGGNPYFLRELWYANASEPPDDLIALVRARLQASIPAWANQTLQAVAILGGDADFAVIKATCGRSEEETINALDALVDAGVLVLQGERYQFAHPLVATIVRQELAPARRAFLHRRAAQALERSSIATPGRLVEHYAAAGDAHSAAQYAEQASQQALALGAFAEAVRYGQLTVGWEATAERQLLLGEALMSVGEVSTAQQQFRDVLERSEQRGDLVGAARACLMLTQIAIIQNEPQHAQAWLERAPIEQIQDSEPAVSVQLHLMRAAVARQTRDYAHSAAQLDVAEQLALQHQFALQMQPILFERGNLQADQGLRAEAIATFERVLQLAQAANNPVYQVLAGNNLAYNALLNDQLALASAQIERTIAIAKDYALGFLWQYVQSTAGEIALAQGQFAEAAQAFEDAFTAAQAWDNHIHMANVRTNQAQLAIRQGDTAQARTLLAEARQHLGTAINPHIQGRIEQLAEQLADQR